jgi:hypothetical protein
MKISLNEIAKSYEGQDVKILEIQNNAFIVVDAEDYDKVKDYTWGVSQGRVKTTIDNAKIRLSSFILQSPKGKPVYYINGNTLDNRKCNLTLNKSFKHWS